MTKGDPLLPAAFATVQFCTPTVIVATIAVIIVALLIPLIYFTEKPAVCILLVINELRQDLLFKDEYCVHGKRIAVTKRIPKIASSKEGDIFYSAGLFSSQKKASALIGTQYGFTLQQEDIDKITFNFGVECPLSQGKNSCLVGCNQTSKSIAEQTDKHQKQQDTCIHNEYELEIKCHSPKGSAAYYIARIGYK